MVEINAAALAVPCCAPVSRIVVSLCAVPVCDYPNKPFGFAESVAMHNFTGFFVDRICPLIEHYPEFYSRFFGGFVHFPNLTRVHSRRLFRYNMNSIKRLTAAREKIRSGEAAQYAAESCGFGDYSTFYRAYVKYFGRSPKCDIT